MALLAFTWNPARSQLRWFGCLWLPLALGVAAWNVRSRPAAVTLAVIGLSSLLAGLLSPRLLRPVFVGLLVITYPIGFVVSHLILAALFFLVLTPIAWVMRALGRDALRLGFARDQASYWLPRQGPPPPSRYLSQF